MKKIFLLSCMLLLSINLLAQSLKVTGQVTDKMGPIAGATVRVKGTKRAVVTDLEGHYTIQANKNDKLEFSYLGDITKTVQVTSSPLDVVLKTETQDIDEVVVTAIGIRQEKKKLGYTTQQVTSKELTAQGNVNVGSSLQGQVAGLTVSVPSSLFETPSFSLRGHMEKPLYFDPFGQIEFAPVGHNIIAPCKVLVQGSILFYPFRDSGFS